MLNRLFSKPSLNGNVATLDTFAKTFTEANVKLRAKAKCISDDVNTCIVTLHNISTTKGDSNGKRTALGDCK